MNIVWWLDFNKLQLKSSINESLTYLRGLEVAELKESDVPMV